MKILKSHSTLILAATAMIITLGIVLYVYYLLAQLKWNTNNIFIHPSASGPLGDVVNGITAPILMACMAALTFLAFYVQFQANEQQKDYLKKQRFEDTFFRLLDNHQRIVDAMDIISYKPDIKEITSAEVHHKEEKKNARVIASKRDCFKKMFDRIDKIQRKNSRNTSIEQVMLSYNEVQDKYKSDLHHYFRFLYHTLKFIKNSDIAEAEKFRYACILRATLSPYELAMLFYNGLHRYGSSHFKPLLEEYSFLKNLNIDEEIVIDKIHWDEYHPLVKAPSGDRARHLLDWQKQKLSKHSA